MKVSVIPNCDFCKKEGIEENAIYNGRTKFGTSGVYMCQEHFNRYGIRADYSQKLVLKKKEEKNEKNNNS